ncbi:MAG: hypothetical protein LBH00_11075 [Planctomycetaceae bacterium]|jgi:hypothetical protein|nr:hypothetical protein [Planctomycetaceae bacterium]
MGADFMDIVKNNELFQLVLAFGLLSAIAAFWVAVYFLCRNIAAGVLFVAVITVPAVASGSINKLSIFWDMPSACLVLLTMMILVGGQGKWSLFWRGLRSSFSSQPLDNSPENAETAALFRYISNGTFLGGGFWSLCGLIMLFADLNPQYVGPGLAVCSLTLFYAFFLSLFIFSPIARRFEQQTNSPLLNNPVG